jgi:DNA-binding transcriptional LysR family regulator
MNKTVDRVLWETKVPKPHDFDSFEVAKSAMLQDLGIALIPSLSVWRELKEGRVRQIEVAGISCHGLGKHKLYICCRSGEDESRFAQLTNAIQAQITDARRDMSSGRRERVSERVST